MAPHILSLMPFLLSLLLLVPPLVGATAEPPHAELYRRLAPAVVGLTCRGSFAGRSTGFFGTGVVVSGDGLVLSSTTVVPTDAHEIKVTFTDGRIVPAALVATDPASEGALLRLAGEHTALVHTPLADSAACAVGDPVYTWGNPYWTIQRDGGVSLSVGRISALPTVASSDDQSRYRGPVIETDAAINPGSDGGPLTDAAGNLIGLQSLAFTEQRWLGLAVPTARLRAGLPELSALPVVEPAGKVGPAWRRERTLTARARGYAAYVVGIWVERRGDDRRPPEDRRAEEVEVREGIPRARRALRERMIPQGCCTGFLVSPDGLVATSALNVHHRVPFGRGRRRWKEEDDPPGEVLKIWVYLPDGSRHPAELLGRDAGRDLAVLRAAGVADAPHLELSAAPPAPPAVGASVALLGRSEAPGGLSINIGYMSALERNRGLHLQISAMVNYGNTGGPVIDAEGRFVGMANKLAPGSTWRQNCGVGFCLKGAVLAAAVPKLAAGETLPPVSKPAIGIRLDPDHAGAGARVEEVTADSPAAAAGLRAGDVIVGCAEEEIGSFVALVTCLRRCRSGQRVDLAVRRGGKELTVTVTVGSDADDWATAEGGK